MGGVPVGLEEGLGPAPAGAEGLGRGVELLEGEVLEQGHVEDLDVLGVVLAEEVHLGLAAGALVDLEADEAGDGGGGGQHAALELGADPGGRRRVGAVLHAVPELELAGLVGRGRERLEVVAGELVELGGFEDGGGDAGEAQAALDGPDGEAETVGDGLGRESALAEGAEGGDLVDRVHVDAGRVLGEAEDLIDGGVVVDDSAGDERGEGDLGAAFPGQGLQGLEAASSGDDGIGRAVAVGAGAHGQVLDQPVGGDRRLKLVGGVFGRRGAADVRVGQHEASEWQVLDVLVRHGGFPGLETGRRACGWALPRPVGQGALRRAVSKARRTSWWVASSLKAARMASSWSGGRRRRG